MVESILWNFVKYNEGKTGYFQGLNFVALFIYRITQKAEVSLGLLKLISKELFDIYLDTVKYQQGQGMMILIYICERLIKFNHPRLYSYMQSKGISSQLFCTGYLACFFTSHVKNKDLHSITLMVDIWETILLKPTWVTVLSILIFILGTLEDIILQCEMDEFLSLWDCLLSSDEFWNLQPLDPSCLEDRIPSSKLSTFNFNEVADRLAHLKEGLSQLNVSEEILALLHEEYQSNHSDVLQKLNDIEKLVQEGDEF